MRIRVAVTAALVLLAACARPPPPRPVQQVAAPEPPKKKPSVPSTDFDLENVLREDPELAPLLDDAERRRVQVLVGLPYETLDAKGIHWIGYRADAEYFYPASAVKLCVAVAVVEKLEELRSSYGAPELELTSPLKVTERVKRKTRTFQTTLRDELLRSLVFSDNDAHNRLFDLVGSDEVGVRMVRLGLSTARVVHRLGDMRDRPPPSFELARPNGDGVLVAQKIGFDPPAVDVPGTTVGAFHIDASGRRVAGPMDFSERNRVSLRDLASLLVTVVRPDLATGATPELAPRDRDELLSLLSMPPSAMTRNKALDVVHKPLLGAVQDALPGHDIRVYGKGGRAYGFSVENSYVVDETTKRSFFVAAAVYANDNETLNDDNYPYESVAEPLFTGIGRALARTVLR